MKEVGVFFSFQILNGAGFSLRPDRACNKNEKGRRLDVCRGGEFSPVLCFAENRRARFSSRPMLMRCRGNMNRAATDVAVWQQIRAVPVRGLPQVCRMCDIACRDLGTITVARWRWQDAGRRSNERVKEER
ncbi:MAG: hypothetical protein KIT13_02105 [Burkholderiales bacterium]|nr:hypothetical protein [Burkholderiales bacterium]MCW5605070.1 hypothetical protein [Burkholderiales bacterium]